MIYAPRVAVNKAESLSEPSGLPSLAVEKQRLERLEGPPDIEQVLFSAMHLLTSSNRVNLPWMLDQFAKAIGAKQLVLYVLEDGDAPIEQYARAGAHDLGEGVSEHIATTEQIGPPSLNGVSQARKGAGIRINVYVDQALEQGWLLKKILRGHASGWLIPVASPAQRLHGYLDALPGKQRTFGRSEGRALQYLCNLLAGYFDRWRNRQLDGSGGVHAGMQKRLGAGASGPEASGPEAESTDWRVADALEEQQEYIGKELHDNIGQLLTSIRMLGENMSSRGRGEAGESDRANRIAELAGEAAEKVSNIHQRLSTPDLCETTLSAALDNLAHRMDELSNTHCSFHCAAADLDTEFSEEVKLHLYRIAQEAANNAIKYAKARRLQIDMGVETQKNSDSLFVLRIQDDGRGFDLDNPGSKSSSGLQNMAYRAQAVGGALQVESAPGQGTTITCRGSGALRA